MPCVIWYILQSKKREKPPWRSVPFRKVAGFSKTLPWVFFKFFKLYKWYQIAQRITYSVCLHSEFSHSFYAHSYLCFFFNFVTQGGIAMNCIFKMSLTSFIRIFRMNLPTFIRTTESISSSC